ncbi:MAG: type II toxin-antitoxin system prevent-host-death family antitoxin [Thermodesulfobacteriota bacterium]
MAIVAVPMDRSELSSALRRVRTRNERVVVEQNGEPVGALVSLDDLRALERLEDLLDAEDYREALAQWELDGRKTVALETVLDEYGLEGARK